MTPHLSHMGEGQTGEHKPHPLVLDHQQLPDMKTNTWVAVVLHIQHILWILLNFSKFKQSTTYCTKYIKKGNGIWNSNSRRQSRDNSNALTVTQKQYLSNTTELY